MEALFQGLGISCDYTEDSPEIEDNSSDIAEVEFVSAVSAGGSVKFLPAV